jgi:hypothetical protein
VSLNISGVGLQARTLDAAALLAMPRVTLQVKDKDSVEQTYEGVRVSDILTSAGMTFGQGMRGPRLADYLLAEASDGYRVVFALPEFDPDFSDRTIMLADRCDGKALSDHEGPLKIIVSDEKRHARWMRSVVRMTVQSAPPTPAAPPAAAP